MKKILTFLFISILVVFSNTTFGSSGEIEDISKKNIEKIENKKTISELKKEVKQIDEKKIETNKELDELKKELLVKKFFRVNLNIEEKEKLNILLKNYKSKKRKISNEIINKSKLFENTDELRKKLLENEKYFYGQLIEYIDTSKYKEYLITIRKNIEIINNQSNLDSSSAQKEVIIQEKIDTVKEKIEQHKKQINLETINLLNEKINKLLTKLSNKEKFIKLEKKYKSKVFDSLINNIDKKLEILSKKDNKSETQIIIIKNKKLIIDNIIDFKNKLLK